MERCKWSNLDNNEIYMEYHDNEWGVPSYDDQYLFEMLLLEAFHAGLSWLIVLKKRESFRRAFDNFNPNIIKDYDDEKVAELLENKNIICHKGKINGAIKNAKCFLEVQKEFDSFSNYIWGFTNKNIIYNKDDVIHTTSELSDKITKDMKKRGFKFIGSITIYSYLQAIGIINDHMSYCFRYEKDIKR